MSNTSHKYEGKNIFVICNCYSLFVIRYKRDTKSLASKLQTSILSMASQLVVQNIKLRRQCFILIKIRHVFVCTLLSRNKMKLHSHAQGEENSNSIFIYSDLNDEFSE